MTLHKLLITGGHPTPAIAVIDEIIAHHPSIRVVFVGRRNVNNRERASSLEYQEVTARKIHFIHSSTKRGSGGMVELPYRTLQSISLLQTEKPDAVLCFGGYVGVAICIAAYILKIPVFLHEQTIHPGTANTRLAKIASKVMISFPKTLKYFDRKKTVITGNPLRKEVISTSSHNQFEHLPTPIILVQGGNLGSHSLNKHIFTILAKLVEKYSIIHQVGNVKEFGDWESAQEAHLSLPNELKNRYYPVQHLSTSEMSEAYARASIVVSRSGASTVTELVALRKPAILVPLPWSAHGEQLAQAKLLADAHVVEIFDQEHSSKELLRYIQKVADNVQSYASNYDSLAKIYDPQAAQNILRTIQETLRTLS